jgi:hypothetical protein
LYKLFLSFETAVYANSTNALSQLSRFFIRCKSFIITKTKSKHKAVDPIVARRGVDYLEILSEDEDENALIPSTKRMRFAGTQLSPSQRAALYYKVSRLDYFLPAILALEETAEVDRAAKTKLLRHILDKELGSRPTLSMAFFDLFFLLILLVTFQMSVYHVVEGKAQNSQYTTTYYLSLIGILYAILRKFGQMSSMIKISRQAFVENNFRWVDAVDWLAIALAFGGAVWMEISVSTNYEVVPVTDYMRSYLAAALCALWFKLVSWLSVINWQVINLVQLLQQVSSALSKILDIVNILLTYIHGFPDSSGTALGSPFLAYCYSF